MERLGQDWGCNKNWLCEIGFKIMDMFSLLKHSIISDEVNPITSYFDIKQHVASCGPEMVWKIYDATRLQDNKVRPEEKPT